jgi:hypothetical protein
MRECGHRGKSNTKNHGDARRYVTGNQPNIHRNLDRIGDQKMSPAREGTPCGFVVLGGLRVGDFGHDPARPAPVLFSARIKSAPDARRFTQINLNRKTVAWRNGGIQHEYAAH